MKLKSIFFCISLFFFWGFSTRVFGQSVDAISDKELSELVKKASESGMSADQIEALAATKGYSASDIARIKSRILNGKTKNKMGLDTDSTNTESDTIRVSKRKKSKYADLSPEEIKKLTQREKIFGLSFFNKEVANFQPNLKIPIPKNYIIGTDDELSIDISGYAFAHYSAKVSPAGTIKIENLSPIFVSGQTLEQAKEKIIQRLRTLFGGLGSAGSLTADVSILKIRSIQVNVIGEAQFPGSYTISSVATAFNLLYEAGGPTEIGSMRNIEIFRGGKSYRKLDMYDYLLGGDLKENLILQDQDILHIPYVENHVIINGYVRNPKTFEIQRGESLQKVLTYAGGFSELAYSKSVRIDRNTEIGKKIVSVESANFNSFVLSKGDLVFVDSLNSRKFNEVIIRGGVYKAGSYSVETVPTLSKLITAAEGLKPEAFLERIIIKRKNELFEEVILDANYKEFLTGGKEDFVLKAYDSVLVSLRSELAETKTIQIDGEVNTPKSIDFSENLTVSKAILIAGGLKESANTTKIEIARRIRKDGTTDEKTVEIIAVQIHPDLLSSNLDNSQILLPFDRVYVRKLAQYETQKQVTIKGEIFYPGPYTLEDKTERISDILKRSGGIKNEADLGAAKFTRENKIIGINLSDLVNNKSNKNDILLQSGDIIDIPRKSNLVTISGNVYNPTTIPFEGKTSLSYYLDLAGGGTDSAYLKNIYVKNSNGRFDRTKTFLGAKIYPKIKSGSEIIVPIQRRVRLTPAERIAMFASITSVSAVLASILFRVL